MTAKKLVSHYLHLLREEGETSTREMVVRGALERPARKSFFL